MKVQEALAKKAKCSEMKCRIEEVQFYSEGYAEPGYDSPKSGIIAIGNWNTTNFINEKVYGYRDVNEIDDTIKKLGGALEALGVEMEWSDEWIDCSICGKLVRTSPNGYDWQPSYWNNDYEQICIECIRENINGSADTLIEWLEGSDTRALMGQLHDAIDLESYGYKPFLDDLQNGLHYGMDADPKKIAKELRKRGVERFLYVLDSSSQFYSTFSVWVHEDELEKAKGLEPDDCNGPSVAGRVEANLKAATAKLGELEVADADAQEKIRYANVSAENWEARLVTKEEFVEGIKG